VFTWADGQFHPPEAEALNLPVVFVDWFGAHAYAKSARARLPLGLEWEKAARGVDGRCFPWGDFADPGWTCILESHRNAPTRQPVEALQLDCGPYGHLGLVGNVRDICGDEWVRDGGLEASGQPNYSVLTDEGARRAEPKYVNMRGGAWASTLSMARPATRFGGGLHERMSAVGFRLAKPLT
jgi:serine/threonine-protein kinase